MNRDPVRSNAHIFRVHARRLSNPTEKDIFVVSATKLAGFLDNRRAYYEEAQLPIVELLEVSLNSLRTVAPDVFHKPDLMDRSLIPVEQAPLFAAFDQLANSVSPYIHLFTDKSLSNRLRSLFSSANIPLSQETQNLESSDDVSMQTSAPQSGSTAVAPSSSNTESGTSLTTELPASDGATTEAPVPASASSISGLEEVASPTSDEVTVDHEVVFAPTQEAPASPVPSRQSPLAPTSGAVVSTAPVEPNLPPQALPPQSAPLPPMPFTLPSQPLSATSSPQVSTAPLQKIAPSPSASHFDIPASASSTNIPQGPKSQAVNLSSRSPPLDGPAQAPQNALLSRARAHASGTAPVSVPSPSVKQDPKPSARRQSSGLDFLQLDLQVAREKKQKAVADAARSGSVPHVSSPTSSVSGRGTPATTTAVATTAAPSTPVLSLASPTVAQGTPALVSSPILRTPPANPRTAICSEPDDLSASLPPKTPTTASRPIYRDLRQRSKSGSGTPSTPKLQITDRGPAPPPEPGSLGAPIVIDEDDEEPVSVPAEDKMEVDVPAEALHHVATKSSTTLASQDPRGDEESAPKPQLHQEESVTTEQDVSASQPTFQVLVPKTKLPAAIVPDTVVSAQTSLVPTTGSFPPLLSRITSALLPPVLTPGSETQVVSSQVLESKEPHSEKGGNDLSNEDVEMTTVVMAERKTTTAAPARVDEEMKTMEISVERGDHPSVPPVSGTTNEQPSGSEPIDKVSPSTAIGIMAVPETANTETTPLSPPATARKAAMIEASPMFMPSPNKFIRTLLGMISSESDAGVDAQPHSNPTTGEHADGGSVADTPPASGKHRRSPTPNGDTRRVIPRKSSPDPSAEQQGDPPVTPVLSNIPQPTTPIVTISPAAQDEDCSGRLDSPFSPFKQLVSDSGRASTNLSLRPHRTSSLSDMDISHSSISPPPIVVLKTLSDVASGTNTTTNSRSVSPPSGTKASEAGTEDDEMVDELAPLFGKEMRVLSMFRPYDIPGEFSMDFVVLDADWEKISLWVRAPTNIDLDISHARCISLACYAVQDLEPYTSQKDGKRENWFENVRPVPWPKMPRHLWFLVNDEFTILYPPYEADMELFDVSPYLRPGQNKIAFTQIDSMIDYVIVLHGHYPTPAQIAPVRARWDERKRFREQLAWLARPISPGI